MSLLPTLAEANDDLARYDDKVASVSGNRSYHSGTKQTTFTFTLQLKSGTKAVSYVVLASCPEGVTVISSSGPPGSSQSAANPDPSTGHRGPKFEPGYSGTYNVTFAGNVGGADFIVKNGDGHKHYSMGSGCSGSPVTTSSTTPSTRPRPTTTTRPGPTATTAPPNPATTTTGPPTTTTAPPFTTTTEPSTTTTTTGSGPGPTTTTTAGPPPETEPTTNTTIDDPVRLRECERQAETAEVAYQPKSEMTLRETSQVRVVATLEGATGSTSSTTPSPSTTVVPVRLRCEVQARIRGSDFDVDPEDFQEGSFLDQPEIVWSWDVLPRRPGIRILTLEIRSVADIDGRKIPGAGKYLYETSISVNAEPESFGDKTRRWSEALVEHPLVKGLGSLLLLLGTLSGIWHWLLRRPWPWKHAAPEPDPS